MIARNVALRLWLPLKANSVSDFAHALKKEMLRRRIPLSGFERYLYTEGEDAGPQPKIRR